MSPRKPVARHTPTDLPGAGDRPLRGDAPRPTDLPGAGDRPLTSGLRADALARGGPEAAPAAAFPPHLEHFDVVDSTQAVVAAWLVADVPDPCLAVADVQRAGRGRHGRTWLAPPGAGLLLSCGFRPAYLPPADSWRLGATVALAMLDAAEEAAGLREGALGLKWPNDLVADAPDGTLRKLGGVLGETTTRGTQLATVVVGIGVNVEWAAQDFPSELASAMTSLSVLGGGRPVDRETLLAGFLGRLEPRLEAFRSGRFDAAGWTARQRTTDRLLRVEVGHRQIDGRGDGVDPATGALLLLTDAGRLTITVGEVTRCRIE